MSRTYKIVLGIIVLLLGIIVYVEASRPKPVNWRPTYSRNDKIPLGTYVFFNSLKEVTTDLKTVEQPAFKFLSDSTIKGTYFMVYNRAGFNEALVDRMLNWVQNGNTLFVAANWVNYGFLDTLGISLRYKLRRNALINYAEYELVNPKFQRDSSYVFAHNHKLAYFEIVDTTKQVVLGQGGLKNDPQTPNPMYINFLKIPFGKGKILLHSAPQVFTNFFMLHDDNYRYVEDILAYIDVNKPVYYDIYHDVTKTVHTSILYLLLNNKYLKWAYYFVIIGVVLFVLFEGKRKQKSIKVVEPLQNKSYDYTRTIAGMYLDQKDHTAITRKKINQFLNFIRRALKTEVDQIDQQLLNRLKDLTNNSTDDIRTLFEEIQKLQNRQNVSKKELLSLNEKINDFKNNL